MVTDSVGVDPSVVVVTYSVVVNSCVDVLIDSVVVISAVVSKRGRKMQRIAKRRTNTPI